jgi:hypothetical protein
MRTYPLGLVVFNEDYGTPPTEQMAIAVLATIPVFVIFPSLQRAINKGFGLSGLKKLEELPRCVTGSVLGRRGFPESRQGRAEFRLRQAERALWLLTSVIAEQTI